MPYQPLDEAPSWPAPETRPDPVRPEDRGVDPTRHLVVDAYHELTGPVAAVAPAGSGGPEATNRRDALPNAEAPTP